MQKIKKRRAQAWGLDLMIASVIFIGGLVTFFIFSLNNPTEAEESLISLQREAEVVAQTLLSNGYPNPWNTGDVVTPGILTNNKIDETKLENFLQLTTDDYQKTKALFSITSEFYITFSDTIKIGPEDEITIEEGEGIGSPPSNPSNLIRTSRLTIYREKPVTLYIEIWK